MIRPLYRLVPMFLLGVLIAGAFSSCQVPLQTCSHTTKAKATVLYTGSLPGYHLTVAETRATVKWKSDGTNTCWGRAVRAMTQEGQAYYNNYGTGGVSHATWSRTRSQQEPVSVYSLVKGDYTWWDLMPETTGLFRLATSTYIARTDFNATIHYDIDLYAGGAPFDGEYSYQTSGTQL